MDPGTEAVVAMLVIFGGMLVSMLYWVFGDTFISPFHRNKSSIKRYKWALGRQQTEDGPVLSGAGLLEADLLVSKRAAIAGYDYTVLGNQAGRAMIFVQLHRNTSSHVVAIGSKSKTGEFINRKRLNQCLTELKLEGDYPSYFKMYCKKGAEVELLHLFDPTDMAYFMDFCKAYDFELYNDTLYISQGMGAYDKTDTTSMVTDLKNFLEHNKRWLERVGPS